MSVATAYGLEETAPLDPADWLVHQRFTIDRGEAQWLDVLATFDRDGLWALDGHLSCVHWLIFRMSMSRSTAHEKLRIAHELHRRPNIADALREGRISYSAARAITRLDRPDPEVDTALIELAATSTVADLERAVRHYQLCAEQDQPPDFRRLECPSLHIRRGYDGTGSIEATFNDLEIDEIDAALRDAMDQKMGDEPVEESSADDTSTDPVPVGNRRAAALMDLIRIGVTHLRELLTPSGDRYTIHIVTDPDLRHPEHLDGTPIRPADAEQAACDAATITHYYRHGEPLNLGRRSRTWNTAQRRAITVRDVVTCRFPGCTHHICDVHHLRPWVPDGPTDIDNGALMCRRHHRLLHHGFTATGNANHTITFYRPDHTPLGATSPPARCMLQR
jgi:hypothetical protein